MTDINLVIKFLRKNTDFSVVNYSFAHVLRLLSRTYLFLYLILLYILEIWGKNYYQLAYFPMGFNNWDDDLIGCFFSHWCIN